jgi:hypothetical protein
MPSIDIDKVPPNLEEVSSERFLGTLFDGADIKSEVFNDFLSNFGVFDFDDFLAHFL